MRTQSSSKAQRAIDSIFRALEGDAAEFERIVEGFAPLVREGGPLESLRFDRRRLAERVGPVLGELRDREGVDRDELFVRCIGDIASREVAEELADELFEIASSRRMKERERAAAAVGLLLFDFCLAQPTWDPTALPLLDVIFQAQLEETLAEANRLQGQLEALKPMVDSGEIRPDELNERLAPIAEEISVRDLDPIFFPAEVADENEIEEAAAPFQGAEAPALLTFQEWYSLAATLTAYQVEDAKERQRAIDRAVDDDLVCKVLERLRRVEMGGTSRVGSDQIARLRDALVANPTYVVVSIARATPPLIVTDASGAERRVALAELLEDDDRAAAFEDLFDKSASEALANVQTDLERIGSTEGAERIQRTRAGLPRAE